MSAQIKNGIPYCKLELQHRMRPRIADLIRPHIYEVLRDNCNVKLYDDVIGMKSNVFFLSHDQLEDNVVDSKTKVRFLLIEFCGFHISILKKRLSTTGVKLYQSNKQQLFWI